MVAPTGIVGTKNYNVGAGIARPFFTVSSALIGRTGAKCVSAAASMRLQKFAEGGEIRLAVEHVAQAVTGAGNDEQALMRGVWI